MLRRFLVIALGTLALVAAGLAAPETGHSAPMRAQQAKAKQATQSPTRHAKRIKRTQRVAKRAKRSTKEFLRAAKRHARPAAKRKARRHTTARRLRAVSRNARLRIVRAQVAIPSDPWVGSSDGTMSAVSTRRTVRTPSNDGVNAYAWASSDIVAEARRWIGTNPTGRRSLWCARFMNFVLERTGYRGTGSDMARSFAAYGRRISGPQVGAIAVMSRGRRGGHVGVVSSIDADGNPVIISGNHGNRVAEATYPRGRIRAYVMPNS